MRVAWVVAGFVLVAIILWFLWPPPQGKADNGKACLENLKNIYTAASIYSEDVGGRLPPPDQWSDVIGAYAKSKDAFKCPASPSFGYAWNGSLGPAEIKKIAQPSTTPLVFDSPVLKKNAVDVPTNLPSPPRHGDFNEMLFADGHAGKAR